MSLLLRYVVVRLVAETALPCSNGAKARSLLPFAALVLVESYYAWYYTPRRRHPPLLVRDSLTRNPPSWNPKYPPVVPSHDPNPPRSFPSFEYLFR